MHDNEVAQYEAWLRASPSKISWKTQGQKSNLGSSSFNKQNTTEEEALPVELEQIEHLAKGRNEKGDHHEEVVNVGSNS